MKPKLHILILGSYNPSAIKRLEMLKGFLRKNEYLMTCLVKDFNFPAKQQNESDPEYNLRKSEYWIPKSDVPVFVFLPKVDNSGVGYELKHLCDNHFDMAWRSVVCISTAPTLKLSSLFDGLIKRWSKSIQLVYFKNDKELQNGSRGALTVLLERLYYSTIDRKGAEWEMFSDL